MAKKMKIRKITTTDRAWYKMGILDERQRTQKTLNLLRKTNKALWDELCRLDQEDQGVIKGVLVSFKQTSFLITALKQHKAHPSLASTYAKMLKEAKMRGGLIKD